MNPAEIDATRGRILNEVSGIEVIDRQTAYEATPGYSAQQSTLNTQRYFTLLIGILVIGGFFQIQTLQKVAQIGMLKAIGTTNAIVAMAAIIQIVAVNTLGVAIGAAGSLLLSLSFPVAVPIVFTPSAVLATVLALLIIGPLGGLVSVWALTRVRAAARVRIGAVGIGVSECQSVKCQVSSVKCGSSVDTDTRHLTPDTLTLRHSDTPKGK